MHPVIRPATPSDSMAIAEVLCASRRAFVAFAPLRHTREEVHAWIAGTLLPAGAVHVVSTGPAVQAMLAVSQEPHTGWIDQLYVRPGHTGRGLGTLLLQHAHTLLTTPIRLYTFQANVGARRFYERHGYRAIHFSDGADNDENCPDVLYEWRGSVAHGSDASR